MKVAKIKTTTRSFFQYWVILTHPLHNLRKAERTLLSELLYFRYELGKEVSSEKLINKLLFNYETKSIIAKRMGVTKGRLGVSLTALRKAKVIKGRVLNLAYAPGIKQGDKEFIFAYKISIDHEENKEDSKGESNNEEKKDSH